MNKRTGPRTLQIAFIGSHMSAIVQVSLNPGNWSKGRSATGLPHFVIAVDQPGNGIKKVPSYFCAKSTGCLAEIQS